MLRRLLVFAATALLSIIGNAQNPNGALRGEVQDASSARVAGARIVVQSMGSSITRETTANDGGEFRIEGLLPGSYHVVVTAKGFAEAFRKRISFGIEPVCIDHERIFLSFFENGTDFLARLEPALDPARIEQQRKPFLPGIPQLLFELQERQIDDLTFFIEQMHAAIGFAATHRRRKMQIEFELILGQ